MMASVLVVAEPKSADAPMKLPEESIAFVYATASSPTLSFPTEALLCNYLGIEYIPTPVLRLPYICPDCGADFATEGQLFNHMNVEYV